LTITGDYLSKSKDIVIIGCGAAGGTAAQFAKKTDRNANIIIFEKDKYPEYSKCGLPYTISEIIPKKYNLIEFSKSWFEKANISLNLVTNVEKIDKKNKIIYARSGNEHIKKSYDSLIICTGADPVIPKIDNIYDNENLIKGIFPLRTLDDAVNISYYIKKGGNATIIGAGLIGLEMADNLYKKGMKVTVIEAFPYILANSLDEDISKIVTDKIPEDVNLLSNHFATKVINENGKICRVFIKDNETSQEKEIKTDLLIIAVGARPNVSIAKKMGCKIGKTGGIVVNKRCETSVKNVYAAGDCTEYADFITKKPSPIGLASIAVKQAITAGVNAAGGNNSYLEGVLQTRTSEIFGIEIAAVGPISKNLSEFSFVSGKFNGNSLMDYYPGGKPITIKIIADKKDGRILASQGVGENAALRINTLACATLAKLDVETLKKLETAYAPPIAPTLDVITLACDVVSKKISKLK
jgi:NADH oxidase (H2O2-forming)